MSTLLSAEVGTSGTTRPMAADKRLTCTLQTIRGPETLALSPRLHTQGGYDLISRFVIFTSNIELQNMDIVAQTEDLSPLKFKVGGATLVFEKAEDWKHHFRNLLVRFTCWKVSINY